MPRCLCTARVIADCLLLLVSGRSRKTRANPVGDDLVIEVYVSVEDALPIRLFGNLKDAALY